MSLLRDPRVPRAAAALLCAAHLALGLWLLPSPMFNKYPDAVRLLREGRLSPEISADFSPLYLWLNAALPPGALRVAQSLLGTAMVAAAAAFAFALLRPWAAVAAVAALALALPLLLYEATLEPDVWVCALGFAGTWLLATRGDGVRGASLAGALLGLCAAARPSGLLFVPLAAAWCFRGASGPGLKRALPAAALLGAALVTSFAPAAAVRLSVGSQPGATMSAGPVLHMGNRPEGTGLGAQPAAFIRLLEMQLASKERPDHGHQLYRRLARGAKGEGLSAAGASGYWAGKALQFARREPLALSRLWLRKLLTFLAGPEGHDLAEVREAERRLSGLPLPGARALALAGLAGLLVAALRRHPVGLLWLYLGSVVAVSVLFYVVSRYRLSAVPVWCLGLGALVGELRGPPRRLLLPAAAAGLCALLPLSFPFLSDAARLAERARATPSAALDAALLSGDLEAATAAFVEVQAAVPYATWVRDLRGIPFESRALAARSGALALERFGADSPADLFYAAVLAARAGRCPEAEAAAEAAAEAGFRSAIFDWSLDPDLLLGRCRLERGDREGALEAARASLRKRPGTLDGLSFLLAGTAAAGEAPSGLREALEALHDPASAGLALARAHNDWADGARALAAAEEALRLFPEMAAAEYERARALASLGREAEALAAYGRALELFPRHAFPTEPLDGVVRSALQRSPDDPLALAVAADHQLRRGRLLDARALAERALSASGGRPGPLLRETLRFLARVRPAAPGGQGG